MALPVNGSTHLIPALLLIYRPRKDERLSWPNWLTCSGWFTHISGHPSAAGRAQDRQKFAGQRPTFYHCATPPTNESVPDHGSSGSTNLSGSRVKKCDPLSALRRKVRFRRRSANHSPLLGRITCRCADWVCLLTTYSASCG